MARELIREGYTPSLLVLDGRGPIRAHVPEGCEVIDLNCPNHNLAMLPLARYLRTHRPRIVHSTHRPVNLRIIVARLLIGQPQHLIVSEHNPLDARLRYLPTAGLRLRILLMHYLYPFASRVLAVSQDVATSLHTTAGLRQEIHVIHNGIDTGEVRRRAAEPASHAWLGQTEPKLILGIGRLEFQKNFSMLLQAFALLPDRQARLMILGEGPQREILQALAAQLGIEARFELPGYLDNPFPFLAHCDAFVLPSRWEGFANVLLEALAAGTPVVSTDCPGGPREILQGGRFGRVVPVDDVPAMAAAIQDTLQAPPDKASLVEQAGRYSIQNTARQYIELIDGLMTEGRGSVRSIERS